MLRGELELMEDIAGAGGAPLPLAYCPKKPSLLMSFCGKDTLIQHLRQGASSGGFSLQHVLSLDLLATERLRNPSSGLRTLRP